MKQGHTTPGIVDRYGNLLKEGDIILHGMRDIYGVASKSLSQEIVRFDEEKERWFLEDHLCERLHGDFTNGHASISYKIGSVYGDPLLSKFKRLIQRLKYFLSLRT